MMFKIDLKKYNFTRIQTFGIIFFIGIGLLHSVIANENHLVSFDKGISFFENKNPDSKGIGALIPYSDHTIDKKNRNIGPFDKQEVSSLYYRHWMGTDAIGRDVLAGLIHGAWTALLIGFLTTLFASLIGLLFGFLSGYLGDNSIRISKIALITWLLIFAVCLFYMIYVGGFSKLIFAIIPIVLFFVFTNKSENNKSAIRIPLDLLVMKTIEIIRTIPDLFIILVLLAFFRQPHVINVILVIVLIRWPTITRLLRGDIIKVKNEDFVRSAKASGLSRIKIFKDYVLPVSLSSVIIASAFGFALAILIESSLSFLGIGLPMDQVTWGSLLRDARSNIRSWWLAIFPGITIYFVIILFNSIGDTLSDYLQKLKYD